MALVLMGFCVSQLDSHQGDAEGLGVELEQGFLVSTPPSVPSSVDRSANRLLAARFLLVSFSSNSTVHGARLPCVPSQIITQSMWVKVTDITQEPTHVLHM